MVVDVAIDDHRTTIGEPFEKPVHLPSQFKAQLGGQPCGAATTNPRGPECDKSTVEPAATIHQQIDIRWLRQRLAFE